MIRRLVLALLPVAGVALGVALAALAGPAPPGVLLPIGGGTLAAALAGALALAAAAAWLAKPSHPGGRRPARRGIAIPRSRQPSARAEPPTVSGYWRALDEPDWPEGEVRRERASEDEPVVAGR